MKNPDTIRVSALIPNKNGDHHIVDTSNELPTMDFLPSEHGTYEGTLNAIATEVTGSYGKIDQRVPDKEDSNNHIVYRTHPIADTAINAARYGWTTA